MSSHFKRWYDNPENKAKHLASMKLRKAERSAQVDALKDKPCVDCHNKFPAVCMDFDHVHGEKHDDVSYMVSRGVRMEVIMQEIEKCDLVCSNCHRIRTQYRRKHGGIPL